MTPEPKSCYLLKELLLMGFSREDVKYFFGDHDRRTREGYSYEKQRVDRILIDKTDSLLALEELFSYGFIDRSEVFRWLGLPCGACKKGPLWDLSRVTDVIQSSNWRAWVSGKGLITHKTSSGADAVFVMEIARRYADKKAYFSGGKWHPVIRLGGQWRRPKGFKAQSTLEEAIKLLIDWDNSYGSWDSCPWNPNFFN